MAKTNKIAKWLIKHRPRIQYTVSQTGSILTIMLHKQLVTLALVNASSNASLQESTSSTLVIDSTLPYS